MLAWKLSEYRILSSAVFLPLNDLHNLFPIDVFDEQARSLRWHFPDPEKERMLSKRQQDGVASAKAWKQIKINDSFSKAGSLS